MKGKNNRKPHCGKRENDDLSRAEHGRSAIAPTRTMEKTSSAVPTKSSMNEKEKNKNDGKRRCCQGVVVNRIIPVLVLMGVAVGTVIFLKHRGLILQGDTNLIPMTMDEVSLHDSPEDCWMVLYGTVYDLTDYARKHPGGASIITDLAGTDSTERYKDFHSKRLLKSVKNSRVGTLVESRSAGSSNSGGINDGGENSGCTSKEDSGNTVETGAISMDEFASHNTPNDCWVALYNTVYDLTEYAKGHPGGAKIVTNLAGKDGTRSYQSAHRKSLLKTAEKYIVGPLVSQRSGGADECNGNAPTGSTPYEDYHDWDGGSSSD